MNYQIMNNKGFWNFYIQYDNGLKYNRNLRQVTPELINN